MMAADTICGVSIPIRPVDFDVIVDNWNKLSPQLVGNILDNKVTLLSPSSEKAHAFPCPLLEFSIDPPTNKDNLLRIILPIINEFIHQTGLTRYQPTQPKRISN